jgi:hypothetical protein
MGSSAAGLSSGKFIIHGKELYNKLMPLINEIRQSDLESHWTLDQPYFNKAVHLLSSAKNGQYNIDTGVIEQPKIVTNIPPDNNTYLLDLNGTAGDADFHINKIYEFLNVYKNKFVPEIQSFVR